MNKILRFLRDAEQALMTDAAVAVQDALDGADSWRLFGNAHLPNFYNSRAILPQGQSPDQLAGWLSRQHPRYSMSSWCFYGSLIDDAGRTAAVSTMFQFQQLPKNPPYVAEWSYCDDGTDGYVVAPFRVTEANVAYSTPFAVTVDANPVNSGLIALSLDSGRMGERGARYRMTGRTVTLSNDAWEYELLLRDSFGCIQVGYGPSSFMPQWITHEQRKEIESSFGGSVRAYLESGRDDMFAQGSYYYSLPLLAVDRFSISRNGSPYSSGARGHVWADYVVQGFDQAGLGIVGTATWQFFAIQFPEFSDRPGYRAALVVSIVTVKLPAGDQSELKLARFYDTEGSQNENGSVGPTYEWTINQIDFKPRERWKGFPVEAEISLRAAEATITLVATAVRENQVVLPQVVDKYEGVFDVRADLSVRGIHAHDVRGFGWGEVH